MTSKSTAVSHSPKKSFYCPTLLLVVGWGASCPHITVSTSKRTQITNKQTQESDSRTTSFSQNLRQVFVSLPMDLKLMKQLTKTLSVNLNNRCVYLVNKVPRDTGLRLSWRFFDVLSKSILRGLQTTKHASSLPVRLLGQPFLICIERTSGHDQSLASCASGCHRHGQKPEMSGGAHHSELQLYLQRFIVIKPFEGPSPLLAWRRLLVSRAAGVMGTWAV